jgi:hypothetical protein
MACVNLMTRERNTSAAKQPAEANHEPSREMSRPGVVARDRLMLSVVLTMWRDVFQRGRFAAGERAGGALRSR